VAVDLLIKGGLIVDGTGLPAYRGDIAVGAGRIVDIGRVRDSARHVVDADGLVVAPGFIDVHTHYDAQLHFEPTASPSSWHGVTTALGGNCGFSLAPAKPDDVPWLLEMLSRVEGMSPEALRAGVDYPGGGFGVFLDGLEGRIGINFACFVGHAAVRRLVMGEAASERAATPAEIGAMAEVVERSMAEGAFGFSSSQLDIHNDHLGRPVPPNFASAEELIALSGALASSTHGLLEFFAATMGDGYSQPDRELMLAMSTASGFKPMTVDNLTLDRMNPELHRRSLEFVEMAAAAGHRIHPQFMMPITQAVWSLDTTFLFDEMATFRATLALKGEERLRQLQDPAVRSRMKDELADPTGRMMLFDWDQTMVSAVTDPRNAAYVKQTINKIAADRGVDPLDAILDLAVSENLETIFAIDVPVSPELWKVTAELIHHPLTLAGSSDGGAHLQTFCGASYSTQLLADAVPEILSLESAISRLTLQPAVLCGLWDRGMIRVGNIADLVIFEREALGYEPLTFRHDFPTGAPRAVIEAHGYRELIVGGAVVLHNGEDTGARPGAVLRPRR
jgi:N-acyl-D-aspartate/D-glutamate deacylase